MWDMVYKLSEDMVYFFSARYRFSIKRYIFFMDFVTKRLTNDVFIAIISI